MALNAAGRLDLTDYGEARFRAGYVVGNLLPYGFIGMAVGRASYSVSTIAVVAQATTGTDPCLTATNFTGGTCQIFPNSAGTGQDNALLWGYTVGAGLDWAADAEHFRARRIRVRAIRADFQHRGLGGQRPPRRRLHVLNAPQVRASTFRTVIANHWPPRAVWTPRTFRASAISRSVRAPLV